MNHTTRDGEKYGFPAVPKLSDALGGLRPQVIQSVRGTTGSRTAEGALEGSSKVDQRFAIPATSLVGRWVRYGDFATPPLRRRWLIDPIQINLWLRLGSD